VTLEPEIIPSLVEGLFLFDQEGRLARMNPSAERILGRSERLLLGKKAGEAFPGQPELADAVEEALREGRAVAHLAVTLAGPEGRVGGGAILLARDETLLRQLDRAFRKADQLATLGTLAMGFAHEIKNPLGGIKGATQLLAMELPPRSPLAEHCAVILREVDRVNGLLESLLDLTPRQAPAREPLNVHEVLNEVLALMDRWAGHTGFIIHRLFDPSLPAVVGDRRALSQVFLNLLKNAVEASPPGGAVTVRTFLSTGVLLRPGPFGRAGGLEVAVDDEGPGFPRGVKDFSPFFTTKSKGVGLGLTISEQIVQNHGGRLILENREGPDGGVAGARARVVLPLKGEA